MCWCTPAIRTPFCGKPNCYPPLRGKAPAHPLPTPPTPEELRRILGTDFDPLHEMLLAERVGVPGPYSEVFAAASLQCGTEWEMTLPAGTVAAINGKPHVLQGEVVVRARNPALMLDCWADERAQGPAVVRMAMVPARHYPGRRLWSAYPDAATVARRE